MIPTHHSSANRTIVPRHPPKQHPFRLSVLMRSNDTRAIKIEKQKSLGGIYAKNPAPNPDEHPRILAAMRADFKRSARPSRGNIAIPLRGEDLGTNRFPCVSGVNRSNIIVQTDPIRPVARPEP